KMARCRKKLAGLKSGKLHPDRAATLAGRSSRPGSFMGALHAAAEWLVSGGRQDIDAKSKSGENDEMTTKAAEFLPRLGTWADAADDAPRASLTSSPLLPPPLHHNCCEERRPVLSLVGCSSSTP